MANLTGALEIGRSALRAQQVGLNVVGNNIANVNTPGFSRKTANLAPSTTVENLGTGVRVASVTRARDQFLDGQFRFENASIGELEALERAMSTVEAIFTEMAGGGATETGTVFNQAGGSAISGSLSRFFNAFQDLANNPESETTRAAVREEAIFLTEQFHRVQDQLSTLREDIETELAATVAEANRLIKQTAVLNAKILALQKNPNSSAGDVGDERDQSIDELSKLINISTREQKDGTVKVISPPGVLLVDKGFSKELGTRPVARNGVIVSDLSLAEDGSAIDPGGGKLKGLIAARDDKVASFQSSLDVLASTLISQVNAVHAGGFGLDGSSGTNFFDSTQTTARLISVSSEILGNLDKIAAATSATEPGDGSKALALSDLRVEKVLGSGSQTIEEFYSGLIGRIGSEAKKVFTDTEGQRLVMQQIETRRENVRGVSINEEATSLILFQRAYQAATRVITLVDELMESTLNM